MNKNSLFIHEMVHNNPGLATYDTKYMNPKFLKSRGYDAQVFDLYDCAQYALLWEQITDEKGLALVFPYDSKERRSIEAKKAELHQKYSDAKREGLEVYFMMDIIVLPKKLTELYPEILNEKGQIDILKEKTQDLIRMMFAEMFREFPQIDGIYIRYGETYTGEAYGVPYHCGNNPIVGDMLTYHTVLIRILKDEVCKKANRRIMYRTWGFGDFQCEPETYLAVSEKIETHPNFYFCIKHTAGDFHRLFRFNQCLGIGKHQQVVEVQCAREYEGKGAYPHYIGKGLITGFEEYDWLMKEGEKICLQDILTEGTNVKGIWMWPRGGGWDGPYINGRNGEQGTVVVKEGQEIWPDVNAYVLTKWAQKPEREEREIVLEYAQQELSMTFEDANVFYQICQLSASAVLLGKACNTPNYRIDVFWTRDQNIDYPRITAMLSEIIKKNQLDAFLEEKKQSILLWEQMVTLADKLDKTNLYTEFIQVTCQYGYLLFSIFYHIFEANALSLQGINYERRMECIRAYDRYWEEMHALKQAYQCCPTLYAKDNRLLDLKGYCWNRGLDAAIDDLRLLERDEKIQVNDCLGKDAWGLG